MSETTNEVMEETMVTEEPMETEVCEYTDEECGGSGKVLALVLAGLAGAATVGTVVVKKIKDKKNGKPKKKRAHWKLVKVEEPDEEVDDDVVAETEAEEKLRNQTKLKKRSKICYLEGRPE